MGRIEVYTLTLPVAMSHRIGHVETHAHARTHTALTLEFDLFIGDAFEELGMGVGMSRVNVRAFLESLWSHTHTLAHTQAHTCSPHTHGNVYETAFDVSPPGRANLMDCIAHRDRIPNHITGCTTTSVIYVVAAGSLGGRAVAAAVRLMGGFLMWPRIRINH